MKNITINADWFAVIILAFIILFIGEPDLHGAIIHWLMK